MNHYEEVLSKFVAAEDEEDASYIIGDVDDVDYVLINAGDISEVNNVNFIKTCLYMIDDIHILRY